MSQVTSVESSIPVIDIPLRNDQVSVSVRVSSLAFTGGYDSLTLFDIRLPIGLNDTSFTSFSWTCRTFSVDLFMPISYYPV
jgi:hypothetical protein